MSKILSVCTTGIVAMTLLSGCTSQRDLLITEWFPEMVELYLDEPTNRNLSLQDYSLEVKTSAPHSNTVDLFGTITGGNYLVVWEKSGYAGPPVGETYIDQITQQQVPGIKVAQDYFGWDLGAVNTSLRVHGQESRTGGIAGLIQAIFDTRDEVDDVLKLGARPRPSIGGVFNEDTQAPILPIAPNTLSRKWSPSGPIDSDNESDWKEANRSFGTPTP